MSSNRRKVKPINRGISNSVKYYNTRINAKIHLLVLIWKTSKTVLSKKAGSKAIYVVSCFCFNNNKYMVVYEEKKICKNTF